MALYSNRNAYTGLNAHLISYLLDEHGGWHSFHAEHIVVTGQLINEVLPPDYYARAEKSLQITDFEGGEFNSIPDVLIQRGSVSHRDDTSPTPDRTATPTLEIPLEATLFELDDSPLSAFVIYKGMLADSRPVARIELLSPSNKPPYAGYHQYLARRRQTLTRGIHLVEIDYIHTRRPILPHIPSYPARQKGSRAYTILVNIAALPGTGVTQIYSFGVDEPVPVVRVPLVDRDYFVLDMGEAFNRTFNAARFYRQIVDYAALPLHFETYAEEDQARIRARMAAVAAQNPTT